MAEDDVGDDILLSCLTPQQAVVATSDNQLLTHTDGVMSVMTATTDAPSTAENAIPMDLVIPEPQEITNMVSEVGVDVPDDVLEDESTEHPPDEAPVNSVTSVDNGPNPHYYVGYVPDDIPERIRPYVVDTTVGIDVAGNNLPDNFYYNNLGPNTSNQSGGGAGGPALNYDNSDTDTASGTDDCF